MAADRPDPLPRHAYAVDQLPELGVIRVVFAGEVALRDRSAAPAELVRQQAAGGFRGVLVDLSRACLVDASAIEMQEYAIGLAREPLVRHLRIAYVGDAAAGASVECMAAARGYFYQRFRSQASALSWLAGHRVLRAA